MTSAVWHPNTPLQSTHIIKTFRQAASTREHLEAANSTVRTQSSACIEYHASSCADLEAGRAIAATLAQVSNQHPMVAYAGGMCSAELVKEQYGLGCSAPVSVPFVDHDVAQVREDAGELAVHGQHAHVQHVRVRDQQLRPVPHLRAHRLRAKTFMMSDKRNPHGLWVKVRFSGPMPKNGDSR